MRVKLIFALICLLLIVQTVSAENRVVNGDFETGDLTGWTVGGERNYKIKVGTDYAHSGNYGCKLCASATLDGRSDGWIEQEVDLTNVETLEFYYKIADADSVNIHGFFVYINSDKVFEDKGGVKDWTYVSIDVSNYTGVHTIEFRVAGIPSGGYGYVEVYLDDVVAEGPEFYNVTFYFIDDSDSTGEYLQNVWLNYSINGELYNATFNSGDKIVVENGSYIEIYEAKKYGYVSELEEFGYCLYYTITNDTTIEIHFHPAEGKWHYIELYFQDAKTGSLLDDVHLTATIRYQGETQTIDDIYDYHKTIWVMENSTVQVSMAHRDGYESELEKQGMCLVFTEVQENITYYVKFYEIYYYYYVTLYFVNAENNQFLSDAFVTMYVSKGGQTQFSLNQIVENGYTFTAEEGSTVTITYAYRDGYVSEMSKQGYSISLILDPFINPFLQFTDHVNITIKFYPTEQNVSVHFIFLDAMTNAQIDNVNLVVKDAGGNEIVNGTFDYSYTLEDAVRGEFYFYNVSKEGYEPYWNNFQVPYGDVQDYYINIYLVPLLGEEHLTDPLNYTLVEFYVLDAYSYEPLSGAVITINGVSKVTNSQGFTYFEVAKNDTYSYVVQRAGYYSKSGVVEVGTETVLETVYLLEMPSTTPTTPTIPAGGGGSTGGTGGTGGGISTGYTPDEGLRQAARDTLTQFYQSVPGFFGLIFLLFLMAAMKSVMRR